MQDLGTYLKPHKMITSYEIVDVLDNGKFKHVELIAVAFGLIL